MNITQFKSEIATKTGITLAALNLARQLDEATKAPTPWLSHWDNDKRVRITFHEDVAKAIKDSPERTDLAYKLDTIPANQEREGYIRIVAIIPQNIEFSF
jgi:hypothetical protein